MDLTQGLLTRRSIRKYAQDKPVSREMILELIKTAQHAPSAHNTQPWEFLVVENKEDLAKFRNLQRASSFADNASAVVLVCVDEEKTFSREKEGWSYADIDGSAATMTLILAAHAKGLGACWCGASPMTKPIADVKEYFNLPENIKPFSIVTLGYPESEPKQPVDRANEAKVHWDKW